MIKWLAIFILVWFIWLIREVFPPFIVGGIIAYLRSLSDKNPNSKIEGFEDLEKEAAELEAAEGAE